MADADAVAGQLTAEAQADNLTAGDNAPSREQLFLDQVAAGHRMMMRLAGRADAQIDRLGAADAEPETTQRAVLRLSSTAARLMERVRLGLLALGRLDAGPGGGPRKVAGYYWTGLVDLFAHDAIGTPANDAFDPESAPAAEHRTARDDSSSARVLHICPATFDKLRLRDNCDGTKKSPHAEPVEARTQGIPVSSPPNRGRLRNGNPSGDYLAAPRCGARTRAGCSCRQPAMPNGRCRFHGGKSTGPRTAAGRARSQRARLTHGFRSAEIIDLRKAAAATSRRLRTLLFGGIPAGHGLDRHVLRVAAGSRPESTSRPRAAGEGRGGGMSVRREGGPSERRAVTCK